MRPRKPPNNTPLRDPITITSSTLHGYLLEPLLGSLSCVAPQQEPRPPLFSSVQYGNGMLANQPVAPRLEVYFPYTGTDSLSVSTCQLPQANASPLGMLCFDTTRGRSGTDALHPPKPSHSTRNRTKDLHGSELHVSSSSSPDFWQRRALDADVVLFSPSGRENRYLLCRSWRAMDAMASCRREIGAAGAEAVGKMDMSTRVVQGLPGLQR